MIDKKGIKKIKEEIRQQEMKSHCRIQRFLKSRGFHLFVSFCIVLSIGSVICSSFSTSYLYSAQLYSITYLTSFIFFIEYNLRVYAAPATTADRSPLRSRLKYVLSFYGFVDFIAILPFLLTYFYGDDTETSPIIVLPYIFIFFKLLRYSRPFRLIIEALRSVRKELGIAYTACGILIGFSAVLMYFLEREAQPEVFRNIGDGLWWAVVTFTTVGYGDIYPVTLLGKLLSCLICMIGIAMIAMPTAIISSAFIKVMQERMNSPHRERQVPTDD